jgi:alpha-glucoside transport system substrate-binding protein
MRRPRPHAVATAGAVVTAILAAVACGDDDGDDERSIDVFGPYLAAEADAFAASLLPFELESGVRVNYTGSGDFASDLRARVENVVDRPDVAIVPQPGIVAELYLDDELVAFDDDTLAATSVTACSHCRIASR